MNEKDLLGQDSLKYIHGLSSYEIKELSMNLDLVKKVLLNNGRVLGLLSEEVMQNKELVKIAVSSAGNAIRFCNDDMKGDLELALISVKQSGKSIQYYNEEIRSNINVGLVAVKNDGMSLNYLSDDLKNNRNIVIAAIKNDDRAIQYASSDMKKNIDLAIMAVRNNANNIYHLDSSAQNNIEVFLVALKNDTSIMKKESLDGKGFYFSDDVRLHHETAKELIRQHPNVVCDYAVPKSVFIDEECIIGIQWFLKDSDNKEKYKSNVGFAEATAALMRIKREQELLSKLADLDKLQAQQQSSINRPKTEVKARRKI